MIFGVIDRSAIIVSTKKVIGKHNQVKDVQNKVDIILKKVENFKSRFTELSKKGIPSFWENVEYVLPQETYHAPLVQKGIKIQNSVRWRSI